MQRLMDAFPTMPYPVVEAIYHILLNSKEELPETFGKEQADILIESLSSVSVETLEKELSKTSLCKSEEDPRIFAETIKSYIDSLAKEEPEVKDDSGESKTEVKDTKESDKTKGKNQKS